MDRCSDYSCPYMGMFCCTLTACIKSGYSTDTTLVPQFNETVVDSIVFPKTIGYMTFYSSKELIKWVEDQQKINEDPNYGIGNWA